MAFNYRRRTTARPIRYRRYVRKPVVKKATTVKAVKKVAKSVHYAQTERKWKGFQLNSFLQPIEPTPSTFMCAPINPYTLLKGDDSQSRDGSVILSEGFQMKLSFSNSYKNPFYIRVLLLQNKQNSLVPDYTNILLDTVSKNTREISEFQRDMESKIDIDTWKVCYDKKIYLAPRGRETSGSADSLEVGRSTWTRNLAISKRMKRKLHYGTGDQATDLPTWKNVWFVFFLAFPNGTVPPTAPDSAQKFDYGYQLFHYFKDV